MEQSKYTKKTLQIERELCDFVKSVESEMINLTKKLSDSENKRFDLQLKLEESEIAETRQNSMNIKET